MRDKGEAMKSPIKSIKAEYMMRCYAGQSKQGAVLAIVLNRSRFAIGVLIGWLVIAPMTGVWFNPALVTLFVLTLLVGLFWA